MRISKIETLACDAGWRDYQFVKLTTDDGIVGWSQFDEGFGSPGVSNIISTIAENCIGLSVMDHEKFHQTAFGRTRPAFGGVIGEALGAIENALMDAKAKSLGVPVHALLGGKIRDRVRVYWSHCASYHIFNPDYYDPPVATLDDVKARAAEVSKQGFGALKSNWFIQQDGTLKQWAPGFGRPFEPALNVEKTHLKSLRDTVEALREGAGPEVDILLDINYHAKTEGLLKVLRELEDFELFWLEVDMHSAESLAYARQHSRHPISSCETLIGARQLLPYLTQKAVDVAIIDVPWNGIWQSMKMANLADIHDVNVAPHNFYGHLSTFMGAHFSAATPNFRIMETDIDRISWEDELFTHKPEYEDGYLIVPDRPGWGIEPVEEALKAHPPRRQKPI